MLITAEDGWEMHSAEAWPLHDHKAGGFVLSCPLCRIFSSQHAVIECMASTYLARVLPIDRLPLGSVVCIPSRPVWFWLIESGFPWTDLVHGALMPTASSTGTDECQIEAYRQVKY